MTKNLALAASIMGLLTLSLAAQTPTIAPVVTNQLNEPYGIAVDTGSGLYYITDGANNRVVKYDPTQGTLTPLAGSLGNAGFSNGVGVFARFWSPQGIILAGDGTLIVADAGNHVIRRVTTDTGNVTTIAGGNNAGTSTPNNGAADGQGRNATFNAPAGLAVTGGTTVYIADLLNNAVRRLDLTTTNVTTLANATGVLLRPSAVAVDASGSIYVADTGNHCIRVMDSSGNISATYGQPNVPGLVNDLSAANTRFNSPRGLLWVDVATGLLISDAGNHVIRRAYINVPLGGIITVETYANSDKAGLGVPVGIAVDALGNFPFVDLSKSQLLAIQRIPPQPPVADPKIGVVTVGTNVFGGPDPTLTALVGATFNNDVFLAILPGEPGVSTFWNATTNSTLDDSTLNNVPPAYADHLGPLPGPNGFLLSKMTGEPSSPYLIHARSSSPGRRPSNVVASQVIFIVANPSITGDNFNSFVVTDGTTNSLLYYSTDGSTPTPGGPTTTALGVVPSAGQKLSLPNTGSDINFKIVAHKTGYSPSTVIQKTFKLSDFKTTTIGVTNLSGLTNFPAGPGDTIVVPIQINPIAGDVFRSLQFRVEVTPFDGTTPPLATNQIQNINFSTNDFVVLPLPATNAPAVIVYTNTSPVAVPGLFTNNTPINTGLAISYVGNNNGMNITAAGVVAAVSLTVPANAAHGQQYAIGVLFPSGTSDGRSAEVVVKPFTNNYVVISVVNTNNPSVALSYVVGDSSPARWYNTGDFGNTNLNNADVNNAFFASLGLLVPYSGSDAFDAMDSFPLDTDTGVVGGDGAIRFLDWQVTLKRSLRLPGFTTNYRRAWYNGRRIMLTNNVTLIQPQLPGQVMSKSANGPVWLRQAAISALPVENVAPGQAVDVPVYAIVKTGYHLAGLQFRAVIMPEGNAPPISLPAAFIKEATLPALYTAALTLPPNQVVGAWSLIAPLSPPLQGKQRLGVIRFAVPASAQTGQHYVVRFANADGSPDDSTQYDLETIAARVWIGTPAQLPPEVISDEWKIQFFGSVDNPLAAPNANPSGDGIVNLVAYQNGSDPTLPRLHLLYSDWRNNVQQNGFKLEWYAAPSQRWVLQRTVNLGASQWETLLDEPGRGQIRDYVDSDTTGKVQFYRVQRLPVGR